jgi:hypothetical protein
MSSPSRKTRTSMLGVPSAAYCSDIPSPPRQE